MQSKGNIPEWLKKILTVLLVGAVAAGSYIYPGAQPARAATIVVFLTSGTSWTVPNDFTSTNFIEVIGGGGGGGAAGGGGGGGAYAKISNLSLTIGASVTYQVGSAGAGGTGTTGSGTAGGDTYFNGTGTTCVAQSVCAKGGGAGTASGGSGGLFSGSLGTAVFSGGNGAVISGGTLGGGGGGAAGPNAGGASGLAGNIGGTGGGGDGTFGGAGGSGAAGGAGSEWDSTHGSGGGGGGSTTTGFAGGLYGGGGAGGKATTAGAGTQGIIVITYNSIAVSNPPHSTITLSVPTRINGNLSVVFNLSKGSGTFVIDDPLDPKNKLLYHSFVESPDAMNIYDGIVTLDSKGSATIALPNYFLALNQDFRYLATPLGQSMPNLFVAKQIKPQFFGLFGTPIFTISGGVPNGRVSWQVTGVRHDIYIEQNPITTIVDKGPDTLVPKGTLLYPELYNADGTPAQ